MTQLFSRILQDGRSRATLLGCPSFLLALVFLMVGPNTMSRAFSQQPALATPTAEEVLANWKKLEAQDETLKSYRTKFAGFYKEGKEETKPTREYTIKRQPNYRLLTGYSGEFVGIMAFSPRYSFAISKTKATSPWLLKTLEEKPDISGSWVEQHGRGMSLFLSYPLSTISDGETVGMVARKSSMKILRITSEVDHRSKIEFDWKLASTVRWKGWLITDNRYLSVVLEAEFAGNTGIGGTYRGTLRREFYPLVNGRVVPECKSVEYVSIYEDGRKEQHFRYADYSYAELPEEEFRLSHYGLPEPVGTEPIKKGVPVYVWVLGAAVVLAILALVFRWLFRRRASKEPKP